MSELQHTEEATHTHKLKHTQTHNETRTHTETHQRPACHHAALTSRHQTARLSVSVPVATAAGSWYTVSRAAVVSVEEWGSLLPVARSWVVLTARVSPSLVSPRRTSLSRLEALGFEWQAGGIEPPGLGHGAQSLVLEIGRAHV